MSLKKRKLYMKDKESKGGHSAVGLMQIHLGKEAITMNSTLFVMYRANYFLLIFSMEL